MVLYRIIGPLRDKWVIGAGEGIFVLVGKTVLVEPG
jgi:hypothetical protein